MNFIKFHKWCFAVIGSLEYLKLVFHKLKKRAVKASIQCFLYIMWLIFNFGLKGGSDVSCQLFGKLINKKNDIICDTLNWRNHQILPRSFIRRMIGRNGWKHQTSPGNFANIFSLHSMAKHFLIIYDLHMYVYFYIYQINQF